MDAVIPNLMGCMVLTFYVGEAAAAFKQYAAYVQRRTATHIAQLGIVGSDCLYSSRRILTGSINVAR